MVFGIGFLGVLTATFASIFIENSVNHTLISNPDADYVLRDQDKIVVIAEERPELG